MTKEELQAIESRANAATPGPWHPRATDDEKHMNARYVATTPGPAGRVSAWGHDHVRGMDAMADAADPERVVAITLLQSPGLAVHESGQWDENAEFIAHARADVPALIDEVNRLRDLVPVYFIASNDRPLFFKADEFEEAKLVSAAFIRPLTRYEDGAIFDGAGWLIGGILI